MRLAGVFSESTPALDAERFFARRLSTSARTELMYSSPNIVLAMSFRYGIVTA